MIIFWDLVTDSKTNIIEHEADIACLKFSEDGKHFYAIDGGCNPSITYWIWNTSVLIQHLYLSEKQRTVPIRNCRVIDSKSKNVLIVLENEYEGYRATFWDIAKSKLNLLFETELDTTAYCYSLHFTGAEGNYFATAEANAIKIWGVSNTGVKLEKRIRMPQAICFSALCALSGSFASLCSNGNIVMLSSEVILCFLIKN